MILFSILPLLPLLPLTLPPPLTVTALHRLRWVYFTHSPSSLFILPSQDAMRLIALCFCGTVLALSSLSWSKADSDEGDLQGDTDFGPCIATLRPEGLCRQGQDTCPYIFTLPPLTVHLPKQLRELEKIVKDLQKLKDNVDQLKKICADCTVRQSERGCERQREREHEKLNEDIARFGDEKNWMNERDAEMQKENGTHRANMEKIELDSHTNYENRTIVEEKERKKWQAEREEKRVVKENYKEDPLKKSGEKDGKPQTEWAKGKDKLGQTKVPTLGGKGRILDSSRERDIDSSNRETETNFQKENNVKGISKGERGDNVDNAKERTMTISVKNKEEIPDSDHYVRGDEVKETENKTHIEKDVGSDGIKMSQENDAHTNTEQGQPREEKNKERGGIKQTENIGSEIKGIIQAWEVEEERDKEIGKEIKTKKTVLTVQKDSDKELGSSKATEKTDFVQINPTPRSTISLTARADAIDFNKAPSSTPSPPLPNFHSNLKKDINQSAITAFKLPTHISGGDGTTHHTSKSTPSRTPSRQGKQITSTLTRFISTTSTRSGTGVRAGMGSTTASTTPSQNLYSTAFPEGADHSRWTAKKNMGSNTKTGFKLPPGRRSKPGAKLKPRIKPEADQKPNNPKNDSEPGKAPVPVKTRKHDQKHKTSPQNPLIDQESEPGKNTEKVQILKPDQRPRPDNSTADQNIKNNENPKKDQARATDENLLPNQKPHSYKKPMSTVETPTYQRPVPPNPTTSDKDPLESDKISVNTQNSNPGKKLHLFPTADKPEEKLKLGIKTTNEEKNKLIKNSEIEHSFTPSPDPETQTTQLTPKPKLGPEFMPNYDGNTSPEPKTKHEPTPGQKLTSHHATMPPDQKLNFRQKNPEINQFSKFNRNYPGPVTDQKTKANVNPKPGQTLTINQGVKTPLIDQVHKLNPKSVSDEIPRAKFNKTAIPKPPFKQRPSTRPLLRPGAKHIPRPKPAVRPKPSSKTKTDFDVALVSTATLTSIQNTQTDMPPTSGVVKKIADVTRFPGDTEFSHSTMKTITLGPKPYNTLETGTLPKHHSVPKGFTTSSNSRVTSDVKPQAAGQLSSIPATPRPNSIGGMSSGTTKPNLRSDTDSSIETVIIHNMEKTKQIPEPDKQIIPVTSPTTLTTSTMKPNFRSSTPAQPGPKPPESSTPSARELRVKINQVAAILNNSLILNERPQDKDLKEPHKENRGGSRSENKDGKPTLTSSKVAMTRRDCSDHLLRGQTKSGVYLVTPDVRSKDFSVFCDMERAGGGWTLIQRRKDGSVSFNRTWAEYRSGFGELDGEFWLGNNMIHLLTRDRDMVLRVELEDLDGVTEHAEYEHFRVASERLRYRLSVSGYSGTAGDALRFSKMYDHNNRAFTTPDRDYDRYPSGNCGAYYSSGWWFDACMAANLNGRYYVDKYKGIRDGIFWGTWHNISKEYYPINERQTFKSVRMMIRPKGFAP